MLKIRFPRGDDRSRVFEFVLVVLLTAGAIVIVLSS